MRSPSRTTRLAALALAVAVGAGVGAAIAVTRSPAGAPRAQTRLHGQIVWRTGQKRATDFSVRDQDGRTLSLRSRRGRVVLLAFLDSRCHSACPLDGAQLGRVAHALRGTRSDFLIVSVDPWADTPASVRAFAHRAHWVGGWHWLLGNQRQLQPLWRAYAIAVLRTRTDIVHTRAAYLIDQRGYVRAGYLFPLEPARIAADARSLLRSPA